ncbi:F-box protein At2g39490-like [Asparagus officinalis]|uniref:F-box protein At2g39490-like n=1 Tax=Asparagus officinalis TaxID=4686 RepID=UPI00098E4D8F|nr:F-box protein At2g39490-like [Asparagus officinalis]
MPPPRTCPLPRLPHHYKNFSSLEILKLDGVNLTDTTFRILVSSCKILRTLDVRRCPDLKRVVVIGSKIETLTVVGCDKVKEVAVRSKILKKFHFKGWFAEEFAFKGVEELEDVFMASNGPDLGPPASNWAVAVRGLPRVRVLTLCSASLQHIMTSDPNVIWKFESLQFLKELQLRMFCLSEENLMDIYNFFKLCYCPNLEKLFIRLPNKKNDPYMENPLQIMMSEAPILCDLANLKTIKVKRFSGGRYEMQLVNFLLANCRNLESLIVQVSPREMNQKEPGKLVWDINRHMTQCFRVRIDLMAISSKNVKIHVVSKDDDARVRPTHEGYFTASAAAGDQ